MSSSKGDPMRKLALALVAAAALVLAAGPAHAHVTVNPSEAAQGGFATLTFKVPNESDTASTTQLVVEIPTDPPITSVSVQPVPGWTANVQRSPLPEPVTSEGGDEITEAVSSITWSGGAIEPGQFQQFPISVGPLPDSDQLVFKAVQTYSDGEEVRWIDETPPGGEEPEHPAPVLTLVASTGDEHGGGGAGDDEDASEEAAASDSDSDDDDSGTTLGIVAIVVGSVGVLLGGFALARSGRARTG
jgi:uncharacterized protein YcnI